MIPFVNRFHGHSSLNYVYKNGQAVRSRLMVLKAVSNSRRQDSRIAVVVSKKVLKSSVGRNRIRRRVYECIRSKLPEFKGIYDVVVIVSSGEVLDIPHNDISEQINQLFSQAKILKKTNDGIQKNL